MALMVAQVFIRKNILWLFAAIGWHTALNATAVIVVQSYGPYVAELAIGLYTIASIWIIVNLRNKGEIIAEAIRDSVHIPDATEVLKNLAERVEDEDLDRTRYT
jgi:hypothetical protein